MVTLIPVGAEADVECTSFHSSLVMHVSYIVLKSRTQIHVGVVNTNGIRTCHLVPCGTLGHVGCVRLCYYSLSPSKASSHPQF